MSEGFSNPGRGQSQVAAIQRYLKKALPGNLGRASKKQKARASRAGASISKFVSRRAASRLKRVAPSKSGRATGKRR